jgi:hypothetical protein
VRENGPATPKTIAAALDLDHENVKKACQRMARDDQLGTDGSGAYHALSPEPPESPRDERDTGDRQALAPGDEAFPAFIDERFHIGHLTKGEWIERRQLHALAGQTG